MGDSRTEAAWPRAINDRYVVSSSECLGVTGYGPVGLPTLGSTTAARDRRPAAAGALILRLPPGYELLEEVLARIRALPATS
jgi:hypothetical protein